MRRRAKPPTGKAEAKRSLSGKSPKNEGSRVHDLEERLAKALEREAEALKREAEALDQQTATAEILRVISSSPTNIQPVLDAVAESATRLCESLDAAILRRDGDRLRLIAHHGPVPFGPVGEFSYPLVRESVTGRTVLDRRTFHVADLQSETDEFPLGREFARRMGFRTALCVPLIREGVAIGTIDLRRTKAQLFTDRQVALLQTFADQAVIAIENARLFTELQEKNQAITQAHAQVTEAFEQQTATSEILRAISEAQTDARAARLPARRRRPAGTRRRKARASWSWSCRSSRSCESLTARPRRQR